MQCLRVVGVAAVFCGAIWSYLLVENHALAIVERIWSWVWDIFRSIYGCEFEIVDYPGPPRLGNKWSKNRHACGVPAKYPFSRPTGGLPSIGWKKSGGGVISKIW